MKKLLLALALCLLSLPAAAQCNGIFPANTVCGNLTGVPAPPGPASQSGQHLSAPLTLYRSTTGVDSGGCTSPAAPCLTRSYIWNLLVNGYDLAGQNVTIQEACGTYTDGPTLAGNPVGNSGFTQVIFEPTPTAIYTGSIAGTTLTVTSVVSGTITVGDVITDNVTAIYPPTTISANGSGSGGTGTYTISHSQTVASEQMTDFSPGCVTLAPTNGNVITLEAASAGGSPSLEILGEKFVGNGTNTLIILTQWANILLSYDTFGCNPGQRDGNPSVNSRVNLFNIMIDKSACTFSPAISTTQNSTTIGISSIFGIAAGQFVSDPANLFIPPGTTVVSVNAGNSTAVLSQPATGTIGSESAFFANCGLDHWQMDPGAIISVASAFYNIIGTGVPCYSGGFISNNAAQYFVNSTVTYNSLNGIGPPFVVLNGGGIYTGSTLELLYFPGQTYQTTGNVSFKKGAMSLTFTSAAYNTISNYMRNLTGNIDLAITGPGIADGTVLTNINLASGTTIPLSQPTIADETNVTLTFGGQISAFGEYFAGPTAIVAPTGPPIGSSLDASPTNPAGTSSTSAVMTGLGATCKITPTNTGKISVSFNGNGTNNTIGDGYYAQLQYGTGTAPTNGAALTGTGEGAVTATSGTGNIPFTLNANIPGLNLGTTYWLDIAQAAVLGGTASLSSIHCSANES